MSNEATKNNFTDKAIKFLKDKIKFLVILFVFICFSLSLFLFYKNNQEKNNIEISDKYTEASILLMQKKIEESTLILEDILSKNHQFYSPLALYLLIDNKLETDTAKIITAFDKILEINSIDKENLNLIRIKKSIYLINLDDEELIIKTLNPIVNSNSVWRNMAINLITEYFLSKNQKIKAEEYIKLLSVNKNR
ncbi:hypothetical protein OAB59_00165 [Pelagibacteraceae bacterium]|nr:hypothetical protein [Pelagibacteraceae bacterium]